MRVGTRGEAGIRQNQLYNLVCRSHKRVLVYFGYGPNAFWHALAASERGVNRRRRIAALQVESVSAGCSKITAHNLHHVGARFREGHLLLDVRPNKVQQHSTRRRKQTHVRRTTGEYAYMRQRQRHDPVRLSREGKLVHLADCRYATPREGSATEYAVDHSRRIAALEDEHITPSASE